MSTTIKKYCPKCYAKYDDRMYYHTPSKENRIIYGSPIKKCNQCGEVFLDKDYSEIAIDGVREVDKMRLTPYTMVSSGVGIVISIIFLLGGITGNALHIALLGFALIAYEVHSIWSEYHGWDERQEKLRYETEASERRMQNLEYALTLKMLGYSVPDKYLLHAETSEGQRIETMTE